MSIVSIGVCMVSVCLRATSKILKRQLDLKTKTFACHCLNFGTMLSPLGVTTHAHDLAIWYENGSLIFTKNDYMAK